jgi:hypothetical protein
LGEAEVVAVRDFAAEAEDRAAVVIVEVVREGLVGDAEDGVAPFVVAGGGEGGTGFGQPGQTAFSSGLGGGASVPGQSGLSWILRG